MKTALTQDKLDRLLDLCTDWAELHPAWVSRLAKARLLLIEGGVQSAGKMAWRVKGTSGWHQVRVVEKLGHCDCTWWTQRQERCSHLLAAALHLELFPATSPEPVPPSPFSSYPASLEQLDELRRTALAA